MDTVYHVSIIHSKGFKDFCIFLVN